MPLQQKSTFVEGKTMRALVWPILSIIVNILWALPDMMSDPDIAQWLRSLLSKAGQSSVPLLDDFFSSIAILIALLVGISAVTGFGGSWSAIPESAHFSLEAALNVGSALLIVFVASLYPYLKAQPDDAPKVIVMFLCTWIAWFLLDAIRKVTHDRKTLIMKRAENARRLQRASSAPWHKLVNPGDTPRSAIYVRLWVMPLIGVTSLVLVSLVFELLAGSVTPVTYGALAFTLIGTVMLLLAVAVSSDASEPSKCARAVVWLPRSYGFMLLFISCVLHYETGSGSLFVSTCAVFLLTIIPTATPRASITHYWLEPIQMYATHRALTQSAHSVEEARRKLKHQSPAT